LTEQTGRIVDSEQWAAASKATVHCSLPNCAPKGDYFLQGGAGFSPFPQKHHPTDEGLSVGAPANGKDGARGFNPRGAAPSLFPVLYGMGRSLMIIHEVPNLSRSMAKRKAKKVSSMGMKISPPSLSKA